MRKVILPLLCCLPLVGISQKVHDWQVNYQNTVISLDYKGKTVISAIALGGYKTNYSGARFNLNGATLTHEDETFVWKKKTDYEKNIYRTWCCRSVFSMHSIKHR